MNEAQLETIEQIREFRYTTSFVRCPKYCGRFTMLAGGYGSPRKRKHLFVVIGRELFNPRLEFLGNDRFQDFRKIVLGANLLVAGYFIDERNDADVS